MKKYFELSKRNTNVKTEVLAGITTFLAMSYILFVNPLILSDAGMDKGAVFVATALAAAIGTLIMGLLANYPIALAPGMGMNAFFTYSVVLTMGFSWQSALAAIFVSGLLFIVLSVTGLRKMIIDAIPISLKYAVGAGIGFFIAFIGLQNAGIIVADQATLVKLGDLTIEGTLISIIGLTITAVLYVKKIKGAIFIGIISCIIMGTVSPVVAIAGMLIAVVLYMTKIKGAILWGVLACVIIGLITKDISFPSSASQIISTPPSLSTFGAIFKPLTDMSTFTLQFFIIVLTFLFVDFFDTAGTIIAVGTRAGLIDKRGEIQGSQKALLADSSATVIGAVLGTSSTTSYIESLTGVEEGGKTGLTSVVTAILFLAALLFSPLLDVVTQYATAPALIMVGALMVSSAVHIDWNDVATTIPAFLTIIIMITSYSIANGIAAGFIFYVILMVATKRAKEVHVLLYILSLLFLVYFAFAQV